MCEIGAEALYAGIGGLHFFHRGGNIGGRGALNEKAEGKKGTEENSQQSANVFFLIPSEVGGRGRQRPRVQLKKARKSGPEKVRGGEPPRGMLIQRLRRTG